MITRLHVDNFRTLVNFDLSLGAKQLLLGPNGSGKSTVWEVLSTLRAFLADQRKADELFHPGTLTRWRTTPEQAFVLTLDRDGSTYEYKLVVEHREPGAPWRWRAAGELFEGGHEGVNFNRSDVSRSRVLSEVLSVDDRPVFEYTMGEVHLFSDDYTPGPHYPFDWARSAIATILPRHDNKQLSWFLERVRDIYCTRIEPSRMNPVASTEERFPTSDLSNFAAWFRHLHQSDGARSGRYMHALGTVIDGLDTIILEQVGQNARVLQARFRPVPDESTRLLDAVPPVFSFSELSDGQRALAALYALLHFVLDTGGTLCIDEPDNFISIEEIQPWLHEALDRVDDRGGQLILISHHPELLDNLAVDCGIQFSREGCGPVRVKPFAGIPDSTLPPSEQIARGWTDA